MKYLYILLICLILLYLLSRYFEKYYSQENFDPSLVPVSSIITLAKVAQKIVDNNGTLINPGNLQIGIPSAKGNLTVTGNEQVDGTLNVKSATTLSNTLGVTGNTAVNGILNVNGNTTVGSLNVTGLSNLNDGLKVTGNTSTTGTLAVGATDSQGYTLGVNGTLGVTSNTGIGGTLGVTGLSTFAGGAIINASNTPSATSLTVNGNEYINGNSKINGTLNVTGDSIISNSLTAPTVNVGSSLNINARNSTTASPVAGYTLYSDFGEDFAVWSKNGKIFWIEQNGNVNIKGTLTINGTTLTSSNGKLEVSNPIVNTNAEFSSGKLTSPIMSGYPRLNANSIGDAYFSFYRGNTRVGWAGFTGNESVKMSQG
jgi:hypothetical protein